MHNNAPRGSVSRSLALTKPVSLLYGVLFLSAMVLLLIPNKVSAASFFYTFNTPGTLLEAGSMGESASPYFWLNSGGKFILRDSVGGTIHGALPLSDPWRILYAASNPVDTDNGAHPQNLFRLVTKNVWQNARAEAYFKIDSDQLSASSNRNASNGLLLMNRYASNGQTLYYAGLRVDGNAVIKKKVNGSYTTLAVRKMFAGTYDRTAMPNILPHRTWIGLRTETIDNADGSVMVKLYMDNGYTGVWKEILSTKDSVNPIRGNGYAGIRTDFMDVTFENYRITSL